MKKKDILIYTVIGITMICWKVLYEMHGEIFAKMLLKPISLFIQMFFDSPFIYVHPVGYVSQTLGISIGRECAGMNFFMIIFFMLMACFLGRFRRIDKKILGSISFLLYSYGITVLAGISRIIVSVFVLLWVELLDPRVERLIHLVVGILFYFAYVWISYFIFSALLKKEVVPI